MTCVHLSVCAEPSAAYHPTQPLLAQPEHLFLNDDPGLLTFPPDLPWSELLSGTSVAGAHATAPPPNRS